MKLKDFVEIYSIEHTQNLVDDIFLKESEAVMQVSVGNQLSDYLTSYGYLAYKHIELYGMNSIQKLKSDMITETVYLHKYFPKTENMIALEDLGDDLYVLVSPDDFVFYFDTVSDEVKAVGKTLEEYVISHFLEAID